MNTKNSSKVLGINEIKNYLPHRYPFLLVDRVLDYEVGKSIHGIKNLTNNESFFNGHFPLQPVMPGVLIIEALAQAAGILYFLTTGTKAVETEYYYLVGIDNARFKHIVYPGDQLHLHVQMVRNKLSLWVFNAEATVNGETVCSVELKVVKGVLKDD